MPKNNKDIKKNNYNQKAKNYVIENNILYFIGFSHNNIKKWMIPCKKDKFNILKNAYKNNGHLGINRTKNQWKAKSNDNYKRSFRMFRYLWLGNTSKIKGYLWLYIGKQYDWINF